MSTQKPMIFPVSFQKSVISGGLNSTLMTFFLFGAYYGLFFYTFWSYVLRSKSRRNAITIGVVALFAINVGELFMNWYFTNLCFVRATESRLDIFNKTVLDGVFSVIDDILQGVGQIIADTLLFWRCWHMLAEKRPHRLILAGLYSVEIGLLVATLIISGLLLSSPDTYRTAVFLRKFNLIEAGSLCVSALTNMTETVLIGAQIRYSTRTNRQARKRYQHIIGIIVQSSALYSVCLLEQAVIGLFFTGNLAVTGTALINSNVYTTGISCFVAAFAPTLMVVRLLLEKGRTTTYSTNDTASEAHPDIVVPPAAHDKFPQQDTCLEIQLVHLDNSTDGLNATEV